MARGSTTTRRAPVPKGAAGPQTFNQPLTGTLSFAGSLPRRTAKLLTATLSFVGALTKSFLKSFTATLALINVTRLYSTTITADGPTSYWRLGEPSGTSAADSVGTNTGTYVNTPTLGATGLITGDTDTAASFAAASTQEVTFPGPVLSVTDSAIAFWFKWTAGINGLFAETGSNWVALDNGGTFAVRVGSSTTRSTSVTTASVRDGNRHHFVLSIIGGIATVYVDNAVATSFAAGATAPTMPWHFSRGTLTNYVDSTIDEIAMYPFGLTRDQVAEHYSTGLNQQGFGKAIGHGVAATLSFVGSLPRAITHGLSATLSFAGSAVKFTTHALTAATLNFVGALAASKLFLKNLTATLSFNPSTPAFRAVGTPVFTPTNTVADPTVLSPLKDGTTAIGDLMVCATYCRSNVATVATPAGWVLHPNFPKRHGTSGGGTWYVFLRPADGTGNDAPTLSWTGMVTGSTGESSSAHIISFSNATITPDGTATFTATTSGATITVPSMTTAVDKSLWIALVGRAQDIAQSFTISAPLTEAADVNTLNAAGHGAESSYAVQSPAGATGTATCTPSVTTSVLTTAVSFAVQAAGSNTLVRNVNKLMTGGLSFVGSLQRSISKGLTATLSFTGSLIKQTGKALAATLSFGGFATPTFRAAGTWVLTGSSISDPTVLSPVADGTTAIGDQMVCITESRSNTATVTTPTGWSLANGFPVASATASGGKIYVFTRPADGTANDAPTITWTGVVTGLSGDSCGAAILSYSNLTGVQDAISAITDTTTTSTATIPAATTVTDKSLVLGIALKVQDGNVTSTVTNFTERLDQSTALALGHVIEASDTVVSPAGSSGTATVTWSSATSARLLAVSVAMKAAASPNTLVRNINKTMTGGLSFIGSLATLLVSGGTHFTQSLNATLNFTGSLPRLTSKLLTASQAFSGAVLKRTSKGLTGALTFAGAIQRAIFKGLTATLSFAGSLVRAIAHKMTATASFTGSLLKSNFRSFTGTLSFTGTIKRQTNKALVGTLSFVGALPRQIRKGIAATLNFVGTLTIAAAGHTQMAFSATLSFVGTNTRRTSKLMSATLSFVGSLGKGRFLNLTATLNFAGAVAKRTSHLVTATLSFIGTLPKRTSHAFTAALALSGSLVKQTAHRLAATLTPTGTLGRSIALHLGAALAFSGSLARRIATSLRASLGLVGSFVAHQGSNVIQVVFAATLGLSGAISKRTNKQLQALLSLRGFFGSGIRNAASRLLVVQQKISDFVGQASEQLRISQTTTVAHTPDHALTVATNQLSRQSIPSTQTVARTDSGLTVADQTLGFRLVQDSEDDETFHLYPTLVSGE